MSTEDRTAARDEVWFTITAATSGNPLGPHLPPPVSVNLYAKTCGVTLTFDTVENGRKWARWLGVEDTESVNPTAGVFWCDVSEDKRCGWYWSIAVYAHDLHRPTAEQVTVAALSPDSLPVRCPRCGHDEHVHESEEPGSARCCLDCAGFCSPVVVPLGSRS